LDINTISRASLVILDYGTGNLSSIKRCLDRMGARSAVSSRAGAIASADKIILPGVGHFGRAMSSLRESGLLDELNEAVLVKRKPVLGICLGMELMAESSEEGNAEGLGWLKARTIKFRIEDTARHKVPHMGWNGINVRKPSELLRDVDADAEFYFAHSYHLELEEEADLLTETEYERSFPSSIESENIFGVQYHPEKSHDAGARLLKNFVDL